MNKKQVTRLTENQFHQIVKESVKRVLKEGVDSDILKAMKTFYLAASKLNTAFAYSDAAYRYSNEETWEEALAKIENKAVEFIKERS